MMKKILSTVLAAVFCAGVAGTAMTAEAASKPDHKPAAVHQVKDKAPEHKEKSHDMRDDHKRPHHRPMHHKPMPRHFHR